LQSFELDIQVRLLSVSAHPAIEDQQPPIELAHQPLNLSAWHADFPAYRHGLNATGFDPTPDGDRVQSYLMGGCPNAQEFLFLFDHRLFPWRSADSAVMAKECHRTASLTPLASLQWIG
jgi:hypothetical protein